MTGKSPSPLLSLLALVLAAVFLPAAMAGASSISYLGSDGNVWLASPDGKVRKKLTSDASADVRYKSPTQQNDGTVVATRGNTFTGFAVFMRPSDGKVLTTWALPKDGTSSFAPLFGGQIAPAGGIFVFDWAYSNAGSTDQKVSVINGPGFTDPCGLNCFGEAVLPRWIPGTNSFAFVNRFLDRIYVQGAPPQSWLATAGGELLGSFDISTTGRSLIETKDPGATTSRFYLLQNDGPPPATFTALCYAENFAPEASHPRWSPDGSMISWTGADGIYVSAAPTDQGDTCGLSPKLVAPGGKDASWGPANVTGAQCAKAAASKKKKKKKKPACGKKKKKKKRKKK